MLAFLLDTNVVSEYARPVPDVRVRARMARQAPVDLFLSAITLAELVRGAVKVAFDLRQEKERERI